MLLAEWILLLNAYSFNYSTGYWTGQLGQCTEWVKGWIPGGCIDIYFFTCRESILALGVQAPGEGCWLLIGVWCWGVGCDKIRLKSPIWLHDVTLKQRDKFTPLIMKAKEMHFFFLLWRCDPTRVMVSSFLRILDHTQRRTTFGRTPLDEWSAHRRDLCLTTHNTYNRQIFMPPVGFETTISAGERPQTYALDRAATGTGQRGALFLKFIG